MKLVKYTAAGTKSSISVADEIFAVKINQPLLSQVINSYLSNRRQGTSKVQTRSQVSRTKSKWYKQKGTGRARHGARSANIFVGGGVVHGPTGLANWQRVIPKKLRSKALAVALSAQAENCSVHAGIVSLNGKTKSAAQLIESLKLPKNSKLLVVLHQPNQKVIRAFRNLPRVKVIRVQDMNALDVSASDHLLFMPEAVKELEQRFA